MPTPAATHTVGSVYSALQIDAHSENRSTRLHVLVWETGAGASNTAGPINTPTDRYVWGRKSVAPHRKFVFKCAGDRGKNPNFLCELCLPKLKLGSSSKKSLYNLKQHINRRSRGIVVSQASLENLVVSFSVENMILLQVNWTTAIFSGQRHKWMLNNDFIAYIFTIFVTVSRTIILSKS